MPDKTIPERLADCEKFETDLQSDLVSLSRTLREDLEILAVFSNPHLIGQVRQYTTGNPSAKPAIKEKCLRFLERYGSLEAP